MGYYDDEQPELSLGDIARVLEGQDKTVFADLMMKAVSALNDETGGLVEALKGENRNLKLRVDSLSGSLKAAQAALTQAHTRVAVLEASIAELRLTLGATDSERAAALLAENDRLKATVKVQREKIGRYEGWEGAEETSLGSAPTILDYQPAGLN